MPRKDEIRNLLEKYYRHLQKLKEQQASFGLHIEAMNILRDDSFNETRENLQMLKFLPFSKRLNANEKRKYAIEILVSNLSSAEAFINTVTVAGFKHKHGISYARWPSIYTHELNIQLEAYSEKSDFVLFDGAAREAGNRWGRPVSGYLLTQGKHRFEFEISFPLLLQIKPKNKGLIRFIFNAPKAVAIGTKEILREEKDSSLSQKKLQLLLKSVSDEGWENYATGIILEGDFTEPILAQIKDDTLLTFLLTNRHRLDEEVGSTNQSDIPNNYSVQKEFDDISYKYDIIREEIIPGSLKDFQALMHEIYELQPPFREDSIYLQGERTPSDYPENMGRWEVTLGETLNKRGFILARQLPNGTTKLQIAYYSKFNPIGTQFDIEFVNQLLKQDISQVESKLANENRRIFHKNLIHHFNTDELRMIAFELHIQHENFSNKLDSFARELIEHCERHQRIAELKEICQKNRPYTTW